MTSTSGSVRPSGVLRRTRAAILDGVQRCLERDGVRRTSMSDVAVEAGVAKATLYNHFHAKDEVLAALVEARGAALAQECTELAGAPGPRGASSRLVAAVLHATQVLSTSTALRRVAEAEPAVLAPLAAPGTSPAWDAARASVRQVLTAAGASDGDDAVVLVLRHLLSHVLWPATPSEAQQAAELLARALAGEPLPDPAPAPEPAAAPAASTSTTDPAAGPSPATAETPDRPLSPSGLGWPA